MMKRVKMGSVSLLPALVVLTLFGCASLFHQLSDAQKDKVLDSSCRVIQVAALAYSNGMPIFAGVYPTAPTDADGVGADGFAVAGYYQDAVLEAISAWNYAHENRDKPDAFAALASDLAYLSSLGLRMSSYFATEAVEMAGRMPEAVCTPAEMEGFRELLSEPSTFWE